MIRDILASIDTGILAQVGLIAFILAFAAILVYVVTLDKSDRDAAKNLPLLDDELVTPIPNQQPS